MRNFINTITTLLVLVGIIMMGAGIWGAAYTYNKVSQEKITTPSDSTIPNRAVRGPLTLKAQADIIREHVLRTTGGKVYAEVPRQIPKIDEAGNPVLDETGEPVMVANKDRDTWITATTLTTALNLGLLSYALSALVFFMGLVFILLGALTRESFKRK